MMRIQDEIYVSNKEIPQISNIINLDQKTMKDLDQLIDQVVGEWLE